MAENSRERGSTRSGKRFAQKNVNRYSSVQQLFHHHKKLLSDIPAITTRAVRIAGVSFGSLEQTTVRFKFGATNINEVLTREFLERFREHSESVRDGFEVVVTFNAILKENDSSSFKLFYGQDHRRDNVVGAAPELKYGGTIIVKSMNDVKNIPTSFDSDQLIASHRQAFENSNVSIHSFLNVIYLIYRFCETKVRHNKQQQRQHGQGSSKTIVSAKRSKFSG